MSGENTLVYFRQGGDALVVASGGRIIVEAGGTVEGGGDVTPQANIVDITPSTMTATTSTLSTSDTYSDAAVKTAVDTALAAAAVKVETRLDALDAKVNALLAALRLAGVLSA